jgi:hypothetical protein
MNLKENICYQKVKQVGSNRPHKYILNAEGKIAMRFNCKKRNN